MPTRCFATMPIEALNQLLFCHQNIEAEEVINALVPCYCEFEDDAIVQTNQIIMLSEEEIAGEQKKRMKGILVDLLNDADPKFLGLFVWYATGFRYIPRSNFHIKVEFNDVEMEDDSLPVAHTCDMLLKLPARAYDCNRELLLEKLNMCFSYASISLFDMQ